jgi:ArsR family transcriptional regulator
MGVLFPLKQLTYLFKALSDPTRLRMVNLLDAQSLCVRDLQEVLGLSQPLVSRHLAILRAANLVRTQRQGVRVCYSLSRAPFLNYPLGQFLRELAPFFPELQADVQNLEERNIMRKSEGSSGLSDSEGPGAGRRNDANKGEDANASPGLAHQAKREASHGGVL